MRHGRLVLLALGALLVSPSVLGTPQPTPTPTPAAKKRKLSGGNFGVSPAQTPSGGSAASTPLQAARAPQVQPSPDAGPSRKVVITNESLGKHEPTPGGGSITITGGAGSRTVVRTPPTPTASDTAGQNAVPAYRDASGRTEADWRERVTALRQNVDAAQSALEAANAEARRLENDFYAWSDGNYRERVIRPAWDQAKERVKTLEDELEKAKAAVADLEEEARKSGTPPGWLR